MRFRRNLTHFAKLFLLASVMLFLCATLSGCSEYWWTRGQPSSVAELMARAQKELGASRAEHGATRQEVGAISEQIELSLQQAVALVRGQGSANEVAELLFVTEQAFIELDPIVSAGSRAALGELSGQLRTMSASLHAGSLPAYTSMGLFTARTMRFLASELTMPAPANLGPSKV